MQSLLALLDSHVDLMTCFRWTVVVSHVLMAAAALVVLMLGRYLTSSLPDWAPVTVVAETLGAALGSLALLLVARASIVAFGDPVAWPEVLFSVVASVAFVVAAATFYRARSLVARVFCLVETQ